MTTSRDYHIKPRVTVVRGGTRLLWGMTCQACLRHSIHTSLLSAQRAANAHPTPPMRRIDGGVYITRCDVATRMKRLTQRHVHENYHILRRLADL